MAKAKGMNRFINALWMIIGTVAVIAIGDGLLAGSYLNTTFLGWIPDVLHTVIGWAINISALVGLVLGLMNNN